jgi:hypothetical protein
MSATAHQTPPLPQSPSPKNLQACRRWLAYWRQWGKPRLSLGVRLTTVPHEEDAGCLDGSNIVIKFAGETFEYAGLVMQPFRLFADRQDITVLVAELAGFPCDAGRLVVLLHDPWWNGMAIVAMAVQSAHLNAAWALRDVEAIRAMDAAIVSEHVASIEAAILAESVPETLAVESSQAFSTRSKRPRL